MIQYDRSNSRITRVGLALMVLAIHVAPIRAQDLGTSLQPLIDRHRGEVAVIVKHLTTGVQFTHRPEAVMPTASLIKFPVLIELYRQADIGAVNLDTPIPLRESDKVPGSGILTDHFQIGTQISLETAAHLMITYSDNTATNLVLDQIGLTNVARTMQEWGYPETQIHAKVFRRDTSIQPERSQRYGLGSTTASDMLALLEKLHARKLISAQASEKILGHLAACDDKSKLVRSLPKTVQSFHKTGAVSDCRTDAGLFLTPSGPIVMIVLTAKNQDTQWTDDNEAERLCAEIADTAYRWFHPPGAPDPIAPQSLRLGANNLLVEALQSALNLRLQPSPQLSVDGDFGPMTEVAVRKFQLENGLEVTGIVGPEVWEKIGPIQLRNDATEDSSPLPDLTPHDELPDGIPYTSCKAWLVGHLPAIHLPASIDTPPTADEPLRTILGSHQPDEKLEIASTTKMMTAWIVADLASHSPAILDERIEFSRRADDTPGSACTARAGESMSVRDALFGLMLPSGNDAATALAEHFGTRLTPPTQSPLNSTETPNEPSEPSTQDPFQLFVNAMNAQAIQLGMRNTTFHNPHGLPHPDHRSSCHDLFVLASAFITHPVLREVVSTRRYTCTVQSKDGYSRNLTWKNVNQLLNHDGYIGIKTGTTDAAGACLVSCSTRHGKHLVVVVLGSSGSPARYADSRNLHRWGWTRLPQEQPSSE
jgi:serine-type D-Ala-D-Ala carboxypeptidase (penicillin-binding protein 5/6)